MTHPISKIRRVHLREVWKHEAYNFTQWLEENIDVLNGTLDLELISAEREQAAGPFSIDLVAESSDGESYVIENQLEKSNHDHLGKLLTYYASRQGRGAIWIVAEPRPEHVTAMARLNEASGADFYLVKVEAIRIDESPAAPLLTLIVGPSEEAKQAGQSKKDFAERHDTRKHFWTELLKHPEAKLHAHITPGPNTWLGTASGVPGLSLNYVITKTDSGVELYIDRGKESDDENTSIYNQFLSSRHEIDSTISHPVSWQQLDGRRACRIRVPLPGGYASPQDQWPEIHKRMIHAMNELDTALRPVLRQLKLGL